MKTADSASIYHLNSNSQNNPISENYPEQSVLLSNKEQNQTGDDNKKENFDTTNVEDNHTVCEEPSKSSNKRLTPINEFIPMSASPTDCVDPYEDFATSYCEVSLWGSHSASEVTEAYAKNPCIEHFLSDLFDRELLEDLTDEDFMARTPIIQMEEPGDNDAKYSLYNNDDFNNVDGNVLSESPIKSEICKNLNGSSMLMHEVNTMQPIIHLSNANGNNNSNSNSIVNNDAESGNRGSIMPGENLLIYPEGNVDYASLRSYKCVECLRSFKRQSNLKRHLRTHTGEKNHVCSIYDKAFNRSEKSYENASNPKKRPSTKEGGNLKCNSLGLYECTVCFKLFKQRFNLKRHFLSHTGEKNHVCGVCGKAFNRSDHLKSHSKVHANPKEKVLTK